MAAATACVGGRLAVACAAAAGCMWIVGASSVLPSCGWVPRSDGAGVGMGPTSASEGPSDTVVLEPISRITRSPCGTMKAIRREGTEACSERCGLLRRTILVPPLDQASATTTPPGSVTTTNCKRDTVQSPMVCTSHSGARPTAKEPSAPAHRPAVCRTSTRTLGPAELLPAPGPSLPSP